MLAQQEERLVIAIEDISKELKRKMILEKEKWKLNTNYGGKNECNSMS